MSDTARVLQRLDPGEAHRLLAAAPRGRFIFCRWSVADGTDFQPSARDGELIVRTHVGATIAAALDCGALKVTSQADALDAADRLGRSVTVQGTATLVTGPEKDPPRRGAAASAVGQDQRCGDRDLSGNYCRFANRDGTKGR